MIKIDSSLVECQKELKREIEASRMPKINIVEEDATSQGKWKSLSLRAGRDIVGPYRSIQLSPYPTSEWKIVRKSSAKKMSEIFLRLNDDHTMDFLEEVEHQNDAFMNEKDYLLSQKQQTNEGDPFTLVNLDFTVDYLDHDFEIDWVPSYVKMLKRYGSNIMLFIPPRGIKDAKVQINYFIKALQSNSQLPNPMYVGAYIPQISIKEAIKLIDCYMSAGINMFFFDFRGRKLIDTSLAHLIAMTRLSEKPIFIHGLQIMKNKMAEPVHSILDLSLSYYGVQTISNLRRRGGVPDDDSDPQLKKRVRCVHGYYIPRFEQIFNHEYECPECQLGWLIDAYKSGWQNDVDSGVINYNVLSSSSELQVIKQSIKEDAISEHFGNKPGFYPLGEINKVFEDKIQKEMEKIKKNKSVQTSLKVS